jgi:hypothetical protein
MRRIPLVSGAALLIVLANVSLLIRPAHAVNDPCFVSCGSGDDYVSQKFMECTAPEHAGATFTGHCTEATDGHVGSYSYSCTWQNCFYQNGGWHCTAGGFGGGNVIDPTNGACLQ